MIGSGNKSRKRPPVNNSRQRKADADKAGTGERLAEQPPFNVDDEDGDIATPKYDRDYENDR